MEYQYDSKYLGKHWLLECYGCPSELLEQADAVEKVMKAAVGISGATFLDSRFHQFSPFGVSGFIVIAESHFSIHTWPEKGYAAIDIFTCGATIDVEKAVLLLEKSFACQQIEQTFINRGDVEKAVVSSNHIMPNKL